MESDGLNTPIPRKCDWITIFAVPQSRDLIIHYIFHWNHDVVGILKSLVNLGNLESKDQRYIDAMRNYMQALELAKRIGNEEYVQLITKIIASHRNA